MVFLAVIAVDEDLPRVLLAGQDLQFGLEAGDLDQYAIGSEEPWYRYLAVAGGQQFGRHVLQMHCLEIIE
jgi:hypothetical protein